MNERRLIARNSLINGYMCHPKRASKYVFSLSIYCDICDVGIIGGYWFYQTITNRNVRLEKKNYQSSSVKLSILPTISSR